MPISYSEIDAYARRMRLQITPFETTLIRRLDDVAIAAAKSKGSAGQPEQTDVPIEDGRGVAALMRRRGAKKPKKETRNVK